MVCYATTNSRLDICMVLITSGSVILSVKIVLQVLWILFVAWTISLLQGFGLVSTRARFGTSFIEFD